MKVALTAFTDRGIALARRLEQALTGAGHACALALPEKFAVRAETPGYEKVGDWAGARFADSEALLFVGAAGIAVRAVAPYVRDKLTDPAVVSVDEAGTFAVPLLSGHVGGANDLARAVAALTGGTAVVSTATDVNGRFAVDQWAREQGLYLDGRTAAKHISAALLAGERVALQSDFPIQGEPPEGTYLGEGGLGFCITTESKKAPFSTTLRLIPRVLNIGVGCRRGASMESIREAVKRALAQRGLSPHAMKRVCTIDLKAGEPGLLAFCAGYELPLVTYTAEALSAAEGAFTGSAFVKGVTGVDNVCERAAVLTGGELIVKKQAGGGVTVAISAEPYTVIFGGETA